MGLIILLDILTTENERVSLGTRQARQETVNEKNIS